MSRGSGLRNGHKKVDNISYKAGRIAILSFKKAVPESAKSTMLSYLMGSQIRPPGLFRLKINFFRA
jgi:hypothetical protein